MASSSSSSSSPLSRTSPRPSRSPLFTPIQEHQREGEEESNIESAATTTHRHNPTPLHPTPESTASTAPKKRHSSNGPDDTDLSVSCNLCRPSSCDKITIVPVDSAAKFSPAIFKSIFSSIRKSPRSSTSSASPAPAPAPAANREEEWKLAVAELSHKLLMASRRRDEAVLEVSRLKTSMSDLEKKLSNLETYCHSLRSSLNPSPPPPTVVEPFLRAVSEARAAVKHLSRSVAAQLRQSGGGGKVLDRIAGNLQPYEVKVSLTKNPKSLLYYLEALLNRAFYEDMEAPGFERGGCEAGELDPVRKSEANRRAYEALKGLTWDEVLNKGTRHYSEGFSRFCDRKMSEIASSTLGWNKSWPEGLLQAFFGGAKWVWLVHLLSRSVHPAVGVLRVEKGRRFEGDFMEDVVVGGDRGRRGAASEVRIMVAPGFYLGGGVVKCRVLCGSQSSVVREIGA
ncbi:hypothetical protein QJS04_geneDACA012321 [Acorus gramineus]|uniref:GIL1/IRKI C-terminal domain-containing protein n=1 Tax=Acorus gramineus TaxID=55184 RepID=A0AAV9BCY8_ACOGR|nr:hypothetical protein QJS04_geneDACA012321 [Acorus gramineus]